MKTTDIIIIGAGAAGLMAAHALTKAGKTVTILEARTRLGGRIHTITNNKFSAATELGAEFVHGNLPVTLGLLQQAGIGTTHVNFEMWHHKDGNFQQNGEFVERWDELLERANALQHDMPLKEFLNEYFPGEEYAKMRQQAEDYVSGYDTADVNDASIFALRNEWNHEDEDAQHSVNDGYISLVNYLADTCRSNGATIYLGNVAKEIMWQEHHVKVTTTNGNIYEAAKAIIALPLGVLQANSGSEGAIQFIPPISQQQEALHNIGFGSVIKILLEFDEILWEKDTIKANLSTMGFLFADEEIPTFWTQSPTKSPLLTGWIGGLPALALKDTTDNEILETALKSVGNIFSIPVNTLKEKLITYNIANWTADPYTRGSYAYDKVNSSGARKTLLQPIANTLYFTGEYLYDGPSMGTVEAALTSGKEAAKKAMT